jgi:endonuclease/exonuclease/phosphatase family metal-dependent hydrolase
MTKFKSLQGLVRIAWAILLGVQWAAVAAAELPETIRVVTYNIHHGEGLDGKIDLARIASVLRAAEPHLVALQEVDQGTRRSGGVDQPAELARLTGMEVVFGRNIDYDGGGYGTAVLSKLPIRSHESIKLKSFYAPTADHPEQRGVQVLELGEENGPRLWFLCTHLDYRPPDDERLASAETINKLALQRKNGLVILAGDLNATPESRVIAEFAKRWKVAGAKTQAANRATPLLTFPAGKPDRWIDYIMVRPAQRWEIAEVRVLDETVASDHRPLLAVLKRIDK